MIFDPATDQHGMAIALREILNEDFERSEIDRQAEHASEQTRAALYRAIKPRSLSPGYYRAAEHLLRLEAEQKAALPWGTLLAFESNGLLTLHRVRLEFQYDHPACSACGVRQRHRFAVQCAGCGIKFRKGK
jgi:hypothetical protein